MCVRTLLSKDIAVVVPVAVVVVAADVRLLVAGCLPACLRFYGQFETHFITRLQQQEQ